MPQLNTRCISAGARAGDSGHRARQVGAARLQDATDEREAIGVRPAGCEPDQGFALDDPPSIDCSRLFDDTDRARLFCAKFNARAGQM